MGRDNFAVPVKWEDGWPVCSWETGLVEKEYDTDGHATGKMKFSSADWDEMPAPRKDDFNGLLDFEWISLRDRKPKMINTTECEGFLRLHGSGSLSGKDETSFVARRQTSFSYEATAKMEVSFENAAGTGAYTAAGLSAFQCENAYYNLQVAKKDGKNFVQVIKQDTTGNNIIAEKDISDALKNGKISCELKITQKRQDLYFSYKTDGEWIMLSDRDDATILSVEKAGGFVGTIIGMFAEGKGVVADFDWFQM